MADSWQEELVPLLKEELSDGLSIEARIVNASLRCVESELRAGVEALFLVFGCFAEDSLVPPSVLDALAPLMAEPRNHARALAHGLTAALAGTLVRVLEKDASTARLTRGGRSAIERGARPLPRRGDVLPR